MGDLTIVIPAYNEREGLGAALDRLHTVMKQTAWNYEIIVVDDGSTDDTAEIARQGDVRLLQHVENRGYGAALKTGIANASHELIVITDADQTYPGEAIPLLLEHVEVYDMVVGSRTGQNVHIPLARLPAKRFITILANVLSGTRIPDLNSGLRVFRRSVAQRFFGILPNGFSFTTTITLALLQSDYNVLYVPIDYHKRAGHSKIRPLRDTLAFAFLILRSTVYFAPLRIFIPISLFLFVLGLGVALFSTIVLDRFMDTTTIVILLAALQVALSGMIADMVDKRTARF